MTTNGFFNRLGIPNSLTPAGGSAISAAGVAFADDFMRRQGNDYNAALADTGYHDLYGGGYSPSYAALRQRNYQAYPHDSETAKVMDRLFSFKPLNPTSVAEDFGHPGPSETPQDVANFYARRMSRANVAAANELLRNPNLIIVAVPADQMHGHATARIAANTIAVNADDHSVTATDVVRTLKGPVDPTIQPQFQAVPQGDIRKYWAPGTRSWGPPSH